MKAVCFLSACLCICLVSGISARADVVYTTSNVSGGQSNSNVPSQPTAQTQGFVIGSFTNNSTFSFNNRAVIRFNVGASLNTVFNGVRWNSFLDDHAGSTSSGITSGSFNWTLYDDLGNSSTFSQTLVSVGHTNPNNYSPNVYQNGAWTLQSGSNVLSADRTYTLALTGLTIGSTTGVMNLDELHWTYATSGPAGGEYNVTATGTMTTPSGTGSINAFSPASPGVGIAYDINAVAVPEPGTFALGAFAFLISFSLFWVRIRRGEGYGVQGAA